MGCLKGGDLMPLPPLSCSLFVANRLYIVYRQVLGPVDPSFRALSGRLKFSNRSSKILSPWYPQVRGRKVRADEDMSAKLAEAKESQIGLLEKVPLCLTRVGVYPQPPWRKPRGKSQVNLPQMLPPEGII